jgi:short subunit dehydrogenase-like uncharacterized protein
VLALDDPATVRAALADAAVVLHCAGPFMHTSRQMVDACLETGTHYLDITGELPVYEAIAARDAEARARGVMLLPGVGFDVVPTDCLALHLKQRLPTATHLTLAFYSEGPAGLPPGTQRTAIELLPYGNRVRRDGRLERSTAALKTREIDFGMGRVRATQLTWGDVFTAYHSTGIPNIEDYTVFPPAVQKQLALMARFRPLFRIRALRSLLKRGVRPGPSPERRARTVTHVWGEARDADGTTVTSRLHGPEAGVEWTIGSSLAAVQRVLAGDVFPGYHTPATAYGADFVLETGDVIREDL